jgi:hypothetical protein
LLHKSGPDAAYLGDLDWLREDRRNAGFFCDVVEGRISQPGHENHGDLDVEPAQTLQNSKGFKAWRPPGRSGRPAAIEDSRRKS